MQTGDVTAKLAEALRDVLKRVDRPTMNEQERGAFEAWYAEVANTSTGRLGWMTAERIAALREGDGYGEQRTMLNCKWEGWQARAALATTPPRQPLPLKELERLIYEHTKINPNVADDRELLGYIVNAARAIEAAHGIGANSGSGK